MLATRSCLQLRTHNGIAYVELLSDDGFPRLSTSLLDELARALDRLLADPACAGAVLHGTEKCFSAGADIGELRALGGAAAFEFAQRGQRLFETIAGAPKPIVAAIRGYCLGGGLDLALACAARVATPDAVFGHPGATLGLLTGWGGTQRLPRFIGRSAALELLLRGESIGAERALALGLVDELAASERLLECAAARARLGLPVGDAPGLRAARF